MSALSEKVALRRVLQSYVHRLDDTILDLMSQELPIKQETAQPAVTEPETAEPKITFHSNSVIDWKNGRSWFSPQTYRLLQELYFADARTLSKEDVRQDVIFDEEADEGTLRQCIARARKEMRESKIPVRIETLTRKGYKLTSVTSGKSE